MQLTWLAAPINARQESSFVLPPSLIQPALKWREFGWRTQHPPTVDVYNEPAPLERAVFRVSAARVISVKPPWRRQGAQPCEQSDPIYLAWRQHILRIPRHWGIEVNPSALLRIVLMPSRSNPPLPILSTSFSKERNMNRVKNSQHLDFVANWSILIFCIYIPSFNPIPI